MNNTMTEGLESFDAYLDELASKPATFTVRLDDRPPLVFRHTTEWDEAKEIRMAAINQTRAARDRNLLPEWLKYIGSDPTVMGQAVHLAKRSLGILAMKWVPCVPPEDEQVRAGLLESGRLREADGVWSELKEVLTGGPLGELRFLKMAKQDAHAFQSLVAAHDSEIGVGWTVEDQAYFREEAPVPDPASE